MFIPKEILQAIVFATIIGIFIVIGFAIYSPKTSFDACFDNYVERRIKDWTEAFEARNEKVPEPNVDFYESQAFEKCR